jgi:hypothetical protein
MSAAQMSARAAKLQLVAYTPWHEPNPHLIGHADLAIADTGWVIKKVPVFRRRDGSLSCSVPDYPQIDHDGQHRIVGGKKQYTAALGFIDNTARDDWRAAVLSALAEGGAL